MYIFYWIAVGTERTEKLTYKKFKFFIMFLSWISFINHFNLTLYMEQIKTLNGYNCFVYCFCRFFSHHQKIMGAYWVWHFVCNMFKSLNMYSDPLKYFELICLFVERRIELQVGDLGKPRLTYLFLIRRICRYLKWEKSVYICI